MFQLKTRKVSKEPGSHDSRCDASLLRNLNGCVRSEQGCVGCGERNSDRIYRMDKISNKQIAFLS